LGKSTDLQTARAGGHSDRLGRDPEHPDGLTPHALTKIENRLERARHYFERAEELRTTADEVKGKETRLMLLSLALSYERMALLLQQIRPA
jgi:hypothetical protein